MQEIQVYLREEGQEVGRRIRAKILGAAGAAAVGGTAWAISNQRKLGRTVPSITANAAIAMATFAVCQESIRAARQGQHDVWNSVAAGSLAGALLTRAAYGKGFHVLGLVVWGPVCGAMHWLNNLLQPGDTIRYLLASQDLLDLPQQQQQSQQQAQQQQQQPRTVQQAEAAVAVQPRRIEDVSYAEQKKWADEIKQREMQQLKDMWRQQELQAAAAALAASRGAEQQQQEGNASGAKRWWGFFG